MLMQQYLFCGLCHKQMEKLPKNDRIAIMELNALGKLLNNSPYNIVFRCRDCGLFVYAIKDKKRV